MGLVLRRLGVAMLLSAAVVLTALGGLYVTSASAMVSLLIEPVSLLLLPGLAVALVMAGTHDYSPSLLVAVSFIFYTLAIYFVLRWRTGAPAFAWRRSR